MKLDEYLKRFEEEVLPNLKGSAITLSILGKPDAKLCLEMGASVLLDKPIIVIAAPGMDIPKNVAKVASAILVGDIDEPDFKDRVAKALTDVLREQKVV